MPRLNVEVTEAEIDRLQSVKDANDLTWRELLLQGADSLDSDDSS